jgi:hypothetical protein
MGACGRVAYFPYESAASGQWVGRRAAATAPLPRLGEFASEWKEDHALGLKVPDWPSENDGVIGGKVGLYWKTLTIHLFNYWFSAGDLLVLTGPIWVSLSAAIAMVVWIRPRVKGFGKTCQ